MADKAPSHWLECHSQRSPHCWTALLAINAGDYEEAVALATRQGWTRVWRGVECGPCSALREEREDETLFSLAK